MYIGECILKYQLKAYQKEIEQIGIYYIFFQNSCIIQFDITTPKAHVTDTVYLRILAFYLMQHDFMGSNLSIRKSFFSMESIPPPQKKS